MFSKPTTIILGAGASYCHGLPTGELLKQQIAESCTLLENANRPSFGAGEFDLRDPCKSPEHAILQYFRDKQDDSSISRSIMNQAEMRSFRTVLEKDSSSASIDEFLNKYPEYLEVGRLLVAINILRHCYYKPENSPNLEASPIIQKGITESDGVYYTVIGWYHHLIRKLQEGCQNSDALKTKNKIHIVTFNYDTSLEHYLEKNLLLPSIFEDETDWAEVIRIDHVFGKLEMPKLIGNLPLYSQFADHVISQSQNINLMYEERNELNIEKIRHLMCDSEKFIFVGYAFHSNNNAWIEIENVVRGSVVQAVNWKDSKMIRDLLESTWKVPREQIHTDEIFKAANDGLFEDFLTGTANPPDSDDNFFSEASTSGDRVFSNRRPIF